MTHSIRAIAAAQTAQIWLDFYDYAAALLADGRIPWLDPAQFSALHLKAQALLQSAVISLPVEPIAAALIAAQPAIREQMRARSRTVYPLRCLLEQPALREAVLALLQPLRSAHAARPLALMLPSPRRWLKLSYALAHDVSAESVVVEGGEEIEAASMYVADFLRSFAQSGIDAVVLVETAGGGARSAEELSWYAPVFNKVQHYRWELGLLDAAPCAPLQPDSSLSFRIAPRHAPDAPSGLLLDAAFWSSAAPQPRAAGQFLYAVVPPGAMPEKVLSRLAALA